MPINKPWLEKPIVYLDERQSRHPGVARTLFGGLFFAAIVWGFVVLCFVWG